MSLPDRPIACTLDGPSYQERAAEIANLLARTLIASRRDGPRLHLTFAAAARAAVEEMVGKERACCAFLDFQLFESDGEVTLTIAAPGESADELLASFAAAAETALARPLDASFAGG